MFNWWKIFTFDFLTLFHSQIIKAKISPLPKSKFNKTMLDSYQYISSPNILVALIGDRNQWSSIND